MFYYTSGWRCRENGWGPPCPLNRKKIFKGFIQKNLLKKMINKFALLKKTEKCTQLYLYTGNKQKDILEF